MRKCRRARLQRSRRHQRRVRRCRPQKERSCCKEQMTQISLDAAPAETQTEKEMPEGTERRRNRAEARLLRKRTIQSRRSGGLEQTAADLGTADADEYGRTQRAGTGDGGGKFDRSVRPKAEATEAQTGETTEERGRKRKRRKRKKEKKEKKQTEKRYDVVGDAGAWYRDEADICGSGREAASILRQRPGASAPGEQSFQNLQEDGMIRFRCRAQTDQTEVPETCQEQLCD